MYLFSGVATSRESNGCTVQLAGGCLTIYQYTLRDTFIPLVLSDGGAGGGRARPKDCQKGHRDGEMGR